MTSPWWRSIRVFAYKTEGPGFEPDWLADETLQAEKVVQFFV